MKKLQAYLSVFSLALAFAVLNGCGPANGNDPGHEYMPDMGHAVSYEANVVDPYSYNHWEKESTKSVYELSIPRVPVAGTIARGYAGIAAQSSDEAKSEMMKTLRGNGNSSVAVPVNGSAPYYYVDTEDDRLRATADITKNPFPITKNGLMRGKELYTIFCAICHGDKAAGNGYLYDSPDAKYPAAPANLVSDVFIAASEGRFYHGIMYGKNVMGSYADKLSYEERWQVIHYIRSLQAEVKGMKYNESENTLNNSGTPVLSIARLSKALETNVAIKPADHPTDHK
jgi:hypothetical protein